MTMDDSLRSVTVSLLPRYLPAVRALRPKVEGLAAELPPVDPVRPDTAAGTAAAAASVVASVSDAAVGVEGCPAASAAPAAASAAIATADPGADSVGDFLVDVLCLAAAAAVRLAAAVGVILVGRGPLLVVPVDGGNKFR